MTDRKTVRKAMKAIKRSADYEYFFGQLTSPSWIQPLAEEGLFRDPPPPEREGQYLRFPSWPQSQYLKRIASSAPSEVLDVLMEIETENPRIHEDLVEALANIPAPLAAKAVPKIRKWLQEPQYTLVPLKVSSLITHLAVGGQAEAATALAEALLAVRPDPRYEGRRLREPMGLIENYWYEEILGQIVPPLVRVSPRPTVEMLARILENAVRISAPSDSDGDDISSVWRPAIEDHGQNRHEDVRGFLVSAVRDAAVMLVDRDAASLREIVDHLEQLPWRIFKRISLHLLARFPEIDPELIRERLLNNSLRDDFAVHHEFWMLAKRTLGKLNEDDRTAFFARLDSDFKARLERARTQSENVEEAMSMEKHWLYRRLLMVADALPADWAARLNEFKKEFGEVQHPDFLVYSSGAHWVGPLSPKSAEELRAMSVEDILKFLHEWQPAGDRFSDSPEGLGRVLADVMSTTPDEFAEKADAFVDVDPTYVRALFEGLTKAAREGRAFAWEPILRVCSWVQRQPRGEETTHQGIPDRDVGWKWSRKSMTDLLHSGLASGNAEMPSNLQGVVWTILLPLTADEDPTPDSEAQFGPPNMDAYTLAINSIRSKAIEVVITFALWLAREEERHGRITETRKLPLVVSKVLDEHLATSREPSVAVRSVYGRWLPWLLYLDRSWVVHNRPIIFPTDLSAQHLRDAAWEAYVKYAGVFDDVLDVLKSEYEWAIQQSRNLPEEDRDKRQAALSLAEHLMVYCWRGKLLPEEESGLLDAFFRKAGTESRSHALSFVGTSLRKEKGDGPTPKEVTDRLANLWDWWRSTVDASDFDERNEERRAFGWWFAAGMFKEDWAISRLLDVLRTGCGIEADHLVLQELAVMVESRPTDVLRALRLLIEAGDGSWGSGLWDDPTAEILRKGLRSSDGDVLREVTDLIHLLGAKGVGSFRTLIEEAT